MNETGGERLDGPAVISLSDPEATDRELVGGKGANLAQLATSGFPIPDGFCVTTVAYQQLIDTPTREAIASLSELEPTDSEPIADAGVTLRKRIQEAEFPDEVRNSIRGTLKASTETYAVRSSATAEDLPVASFAGQQETFLNVRGVDEVINRVRDCMASLFTDRAIAYRAENGISHADVSLAVVVQQMVSPDVSGVLFTADPMTGNRHISSIEACLGLGEPLVSGAVNADNVKVDARTGEIITYEVGDQRIAVRRRPSGGTETVELPNAGQSDQVLTDEQVHTLVEVGSEIEALFDRPQDIEWSLTGGNVIILQARPITSLFPLPSPAPDDDRFHVYISMGHGQSFAEAMPPLVLDVWKSYVQTLFTEYGFDPETQWGVEAGGRIYIDVTTPLRFGPMRKRFPERMGEANEQMGVTIGDLLDRRDEEFRQDRTLRERVASVPSVASSAGTLLRRSLPQLITVFGGFFGAFTGEPLSPEREEARWGTWGKNIASQVRTPDDVAGQVRAVFDVPREATHYPSMGGLIAGTVAQGMLEKRFPDAPEDVNAVGRGLPHEMLTKINLGISDLADIAREHPSVVDALNRGASLEEIRSVEGGETFLSAVTEFLDVFGHRATGELDISRPRWQDDPSVLLSIVRSTVNSSEKSGHRDHFRELERTANAAAKRLERRAGQRFLGSFRQRLVRQLVRTYRGGIQTREYPKHGVAYFLTAWHDVLRDAGDLLAANGALSNAEDVWFLRKEELFDVVDGESITVDIAARRAEFQRHASLDAPPVVTSEGEALRGDITREEISEGALVGTGVSDGTVEGVARVVRNPSEETIEKDEILVAPSSDPGWTPLFLNATGVVVEVGGQMSHGSLVAREYGIPAVVSVHDATRQIQSGQRIRVDGTNGIVDLLE
ncbi:PEP/pyruvate-binding domain-containing protein [Natrinema salaciae]|uniref:Probable phosphoenolpyruvate synthase n=1 Tax=Natrinema salaciae TaxID=1186196 RepID=A0A1H9JYD4_9EURY|nr:PEP/pyruvate-binding domain-containing protein [Natrinema salaciae]SEQ92011.1 phosphoenolpyruvate synthase [Natrinema salaciae]